MIIDYRTRDYILSSYPSFFLSFIVLISVYLIIVGVEVLLYMITLNETHTHTHTHLVELL
jgi:hypothetical protein